MRVKFHSYRINGLRFDPPKQENIVFESLWVEKGLFMHSWITVGLIPILCAPITFFRCLRGVSQISWLSDLRFAFLAPKLQKLVFESLWVEKAILMHILITGSLFSILFLPIAFFRYVGGVSEVSLRSDLRFAFWPPRSKKLCFLKAFYLKNIFSCIIG